MNDRLDKKQAQDPAELANLYAGIAEKSSRVLKHFMERGQNGSAAGLNDELGIAQAFFQAWAQLGYWQDAVSLWQSSMLRLLGQDVTPVAEPQPGDKRFRHEDWQQNFVFDYLKQSYLIAARHLHGTVGRVAGLDEQTARKVDF